MKNAHLFPIPFIYLLLFSTVLLSSCLEKSAPLAVVVQGQILESASDSVSLKVGDSIWKAALVDDAFTLNVPLDTPAYARLYVGENYASLYLLPEDHLNIHVVDTSFFESLKVEGSPSSAYLTMRNQTRKDWQLGGDSSLFELEEAAFLTHLDKFREDQLELLEAFKLPNNFKERRSQIVEVNVAMMKSFYPDYNEFEGYTPSEDFWSFADRVDMNAAKNAGSFEFVSFATNYSMAMAAANNPQASPTETVQHAFDFFDSKCQVTRSKEKVYEYLILSNARDHGADGMQTLYSRFMDIARDSSMIARVTKTYNDWQLLVSGSPVLPFTTYSLDGSPVEFEDFQGKTVYVDVWASWCGPCLDELPALHALQQRLTNRDDIVFVSLSVDKDQQAWEQMLNEKQLKGVQVQTAGKHAEFRKLYRIDAIPRFMIFSPDGTIYDATAPRPSDSAVLEALYKASKVPIVKG